MLIQHRERYRGAIIELIQNNTNVLVDQDIVSVLQKPPLDSMDLLRTKLLDLAKKNKIVLNTEELSKILDLYRSFLMECCVKIKDIRISELCSCIEKENLDKHSDIYKINKKDFVVINKEINRLLKNQFSDGFSSCVLDSIDMVFVQPMDETIKNKIIDDLSKYIKKYHKQLLDNCELKIMVKDTTLMNGVKEQGERFLFTLEHSHLLKNLDA